MVVNVDLSDSTTPTRPSDPSSPPPPEQQQQQHEHPRREQEYEAGDSEGEESSEDEDDEVETGGSPGGGRRGRKKPLYRPQLIRQGSSSLARVIDQHPPAAIPLALPPHMRPHVPAAAAGRPGVLSHPPPQHQQHQQQHQHHRRPSSEASNFPRVSSDPSLISLGMGGPHTHPEAAAVQHHGGAPLLPHLMHHAASSPLAAADRRGSVGSQSSRRQQQHQQVIEEGEEDGGDEGPEPESSVLVDGPALIPRSISKRSLLGGEHAIQRSVSRQGSLLGRALHQHHHHQQHQHLDASRDSLDYSSSSVFSSVSAVSSSARPSIYYRHGQQPHQQQLGQPSSLGAGGGHRRHASSLDTSDRPPPSFGGGKRIGAPSAAAPAAHAAAAPARSSSFLGALSFGRRKPPTAAARSSDADSLSGDRLSSWPAAAADSHSHSSGSVIIRRPLGTPSGLHPQHRPVKALLSPPGPEGPAPMDDLAAAKGMLPPPIITTLPAASGAGRVGSGVHEEEGLAGKAAAAASWWPAWLSRRRRRGRKEQPGKEGEEEGVDLEGSLHRHSKHHEHEEHGVMADEIVNNLEHAKKALAYQTAFLKSFGLSQLLHYLQINATVLSINVDWPPAIDRLLEICRVLFVFDFRVFHFKYTALVVAAVFPLICYYISELFWRDSAQWRRTYMTDWPRARARVRRGCTALGIATALTSAALVSFGHLPALDAFAVTWTASLALFLVFVGYAAVGDLVRKLFVILETEAERVEFFLEIRYWARYLVLVALNVAYLPILAKLFKIIYKAKHYLEDPHHAHEVKPAPWITATILAGLYGLGLPLTISLLMRRRRRQHAWVADKGAAEGGWYEARPEEALLLGGGGGERRRRGSEAGEGDGVADDDALAFSFLELEEQVDNLKTYAERMPLIIDMDKREAVLRRVSASLAQKRAAAARSRRRAEGQFEAAQGNPIDDFWKPLKPAFTWWKLWAYYIERGFLVGIVVTQDGQKVAKSLTTIVASFVVIGGTALVLMLCQPYLKRKENVIESFFDLASTFNVAIALALYKGWLDAQTEVWIAALLLVPNLLVLIVAVYIMDPRAIWRALRAKYAEFQARTREHKRRERVMADRESRALFDAAYKGDVQRVKELLAQGRADVRYEKPKDVKPIGFEGYTPTQIACYMGKHQCLELLLQHHTLFAEEEIVKPSRLVPKFLHRYVTVPVHRAAAAARRRLTSSGSKRASSSSAKPHHHLPVVPVEQHPTHRPSALSLHSSPLAPAPLALAIQLQPPLSAPGALQGHGHHHYHHPLHSHGRHHHAHGDSLALDADAEMALRRGLAADVGHHHHQQQHLQEGSHHGHHHALEDEIAQLKALAFISWSRECLDLLVTYGSAGDDDDGNNEENRQGTSRPARGGFLRLLSRAAPEADATTAAAAIAAGERRARLKATLRKRLYAQVAATPLETRLRLTAAAALHHPRDLQWILDPARGNVMGGEGEDVDVAGLLRRATRKIKHDQKSTKDMKILAMRALCEGVVAAGLLPTAPTSGGTSSISISSSGSGSGNNKPVLTVDLSSMGIDDAYLEHVLQTLWDVTATGTPTQLLLDNNALTDVGVRALVLQYRANMAAVAAALRQQGKGGSGGRPHSPLGHSGVNVSASGAGEIRPCSTLSAVGVGHDHHPGGAGGAAGTAGATTSYVGSSHPGNKPLPRAPSLASLSLNGNDVGTDGALFLADLIADSHAALATVSVYRTECSVASPTSLAFDRVVDRSLSLEAALVVAILVDAYVGLRRFVFTLREADGPLPFAMARLNLLNEVDLRGNELDGPLLPSLLLVHRKHLGGGNRLTLPWDGLQEAGLDHAMAIDCAGSGLTGPIPDTWGHPRAFPMLKSLDLSENPGLEGPVPAGLLVRALQPPSLALSLAGCHLSLPSDIAPLLNAGIRCIDLKNQGLVGAIPPSWAHLAASITKIDLSGNRLEGPIPAPLLAIAQRSFARNVGLRLPTTPDVPVVLRGLTELDLSGQGLHGPIPSIFGQLPALRAVDLSDNQLEGPIPAPLLALPRRRFARNRGLSLPTVGLVEALSSLGALDLSDQDLCGLIPLAWATALPRLHSLNLSGNRLQGPVPLRLLMLEKKALGGGDNQLRLPASETEGLLLPPFPSPSTPTSTPRPTLTTTTLDLRDQGLVGPLPAAVLGLPGLQCLDLSGANALDGALPLAALQLGGGGGKETGDGQDGQDGAASVGHLELRLGGGKGNRNAFRLPAGEEMQCLALPDAAAPITRIALRASCLVGPIPRELGRLAASLTRMELADNALEGELVDGLASLVNLEVLDVGHNRLRGPLPAWLGGLARLRVLDAAGNEFRGPLPEALFTGCTVLEVLRLGGNELTGPLPEAVGQLPRLQELSLTGNQLVGDLPSALFRLTALRVLDLGRQKQLQGTLPAAVGALTQLEVLRLDHNQMYGPVPPELLALPRLRVLSLRHNTFSSFPSSSSSSSNSSSAPSQIEHLDLGQNRMSGRWLDKAFTSPSSSGEDVVAARFPRLTTLLLDGLGLEGPFPTAASLPRACPALVVLDLSQNRLEGPVPEWVGQALPALKRLNLSQNKLSGALPAAVLVPGRFEEVKMFGNHFTGPVPFK